MVRGGEFKSSLVQQPVWAGGTGGSSSSGCSGAMGRSSRSCAADDQEQQQKQQEASMAMLFPHQQHLLHLSSSGLVPEVNGGGGAASPASLHGGGQLESGMPGSWSQLLLEGLVGDGERYSTATALLSKGLEEGPTDHQAYLYGHGEEVQLSQMLLTCSSPRSCVTATSLGGGGGGNMLDFSNGAPTPETEPEPRNHQSDNSSESNSNATGSAPKKARVQASSSAQSTLKVRKERLGDRVRALHQIVSPFGKTDTASVLQETIGYIKFLLGQIEALSYPYLGHGCTEDSKHQQTGAKDGDDDGAAGKKDLNSRGLCLVPVSCTSYLAADNTSDFWTAAPPPPLAGIILR